MTRVRAQRRARVTVASSLMPHVAKQYPEFCLYMIQVGEVMQC